MKSAEHELPIFGPSAPDDEKIQSTEAVIDAMTYEDLLRKVIVAPLTDPMFRGEIGRYFHAALKQKRHDTPPEERAAATNRINSSLRS